ncbi:4'-phosphopantetheinyl transferase family protein [Methanobacterium sp. MBAC-LM]|uniref:4'-phosphopantetheinyl transferase family protein n=1 Tax=Methanobacterium sp. MBAC-LM TaxID=3412034 RepID=UPI003C774DD6
MLLYYMDVSELDFNRIKSSVSKTRIKKSSRYFHKKDRNLSVGVEVLLNHALDKIGIINPIFDTDEYGKPYLKNYSDIHFNLSHSEKYVACAVSDSPVGVDIEYVQDIDLSLAKYFFYGTEYEHILNNNNQKKAFFELWVLKESYMKMTGLGFRLALDEFCIQISDQIELIHRKNTGNFGLWSVCGGDYMLGVCSQSRITEPVLINLQDIEN